MSSFERCVVLVADDEPAILSIIAQTLKRHGYIVIPAPDGPTALDACLEREGPIHLAVLDVMMPGMTGPQLFECLQVLHPQIEVLFMSGYKPDQIADLSRHITVANFITKPFLPKDIIHRVNTILGNIDICVLDDEQAS
jgi:CheY-like chemotaxis protein